MILEAAKQQQKQQQKKHKLSLQQQQHKILSQQKPQQQQKKVKVVLMYFNRQIDPKTKEEFKSFLQKAKEKKNIHIYLLNEGMTWHDVTRVLSIKRGSADENLISGFFKHHNLREILNEIVDRRNVQRENIHYIGPEIGKRQIRQQNKHIIDQGQNSLSLEVAKQIVQS